MGDIMNELSTNLDDNQYPDIIVYDENNPTLSSPYAETDLLFYLTPESLVDIDTYNRFLKNAERRFRASKEYKAYKSYLIEYLGIDRCQYFGNITVDDADVELHHNVLGLFDICILISGHVLKTIGKLTTFDLVQLLIQEHQQNRVGVTFLSKTAHQIFTAGGASSYIPPEMTIGKWWELLYIYRYGITFDIANKVLNYIKKYQQGLQTTINIQMADQIMNFAYYNENCGMAPSELGALPYEQEFQQSEEGAFSDYGY